MTIPYEDQNWDTLEVERWIDNDEFLYNATRGADEETIRGLVGQYVTHGLDVTLRDVDWDYIVESCNE
jgi:hypothetical protein